jgi:probable O-glycosylation ligase (exosortase A-associated)
VSLRDLAVTAIIFGLLPASLARPWVGVLVWSWIGYMNPHRLTWGFAYAMPFAQLAAIATLAGLAFTKERKALPRTREIYLLVTLWAFFLLTTLHAFNPPDAWDYLEKVSKILLITFVTVVLFQDARKLRMLLYVIALSIGFYGLKGGIWALVTGAGNQVLGPRGSFIAGNTEIGLALNMVLPMLLFLRRDEPRPWLRHVLRIVFVFSIVAILITYSRGALVGLAVVLPLMFLKSRAKFIVLPLALILALFAQPLMQAVMPQQWLERMGTIGSYDQDRSARMRMNSWYVSYRIALDHPFLGGGFRPFSRDVYLSYTPDEELNSKQDAHSIYFQVMAEHGFVGLGLYLALVLSTLITLRQVMRHTRSDPNRLPLHNMAQMVEVSLAAYLVSGAFLSMSYFDLFFHLVAIAAILKVLVSEASPQAVAASQHASVAVPSWPPMVTR